MLRRLTRVFSSPALRECRDCGTDVGDEVGCPTCGSDRIATYDV